MSNLVCHLKSVICPPVFEKLLIAAVEWYIQDYIGCLTMNDKCKIKEYVKCHPICDVIRLLRRLDQVCGFVPECEDFVAVLCELGLEPVHCRPYDIVHEMKRWDVKLCHLDFFEDCAFFCEHGPYSKCRSLRMFVTGLVQCTGGQCGIDELKTEMLKKLHQYELRRNGFWVDLSQKVQIVSSEDDCAATPDWAVCGAPDQCAPLCPLPECPPCEQIKFPKVCCDEGDECECVCVEECESESEDECEHSGNGECQDCPSEHRKVHVKKCVTKCHVNHNYGEGPSRCDPCSQNGNCEDSVLCPGPKQFVECFPEFEPKCNLGNTCVNVDICGCECNPDRAKAQCVVEAVISALNSECPGKNLSKLFVKNGGYYDSRIALETRKKIKKCLTSEHVLGEDVECPKITLRKWFWDQKNRTVAIEAVYSAKTKCEKKFGYDNQAGYQQSVTLQAGSEFTQDVSIMFQLDCSAPKKCAPGPLIQYMRLVQVRTQTQSTWTDVCQPKCQIQAEVCDPSRCVAEAVLKQIVAGIKKTSTDPIGSIDQIKALFTDQTVFTGGGGPVVGAQAFEDNIKPYACGSGPVSDPHFSEVVACQNLPFYFDIETDNFAVVKKIAWDECQRALLVEWTWEAKLKKPQMYGDFECPETLQPCKTYRQDDIVIMYLNCEDCPESLPKLAYWREYFDPSQHESTYPCDWQFPKVEKCCSVENIPFAGGCCAEEESEDECDSVCSEECDSELIGLWPCLCDAACECHDDKSCARKYVSPALPEGYAYTKNYGWELRRMFNADCVLKDIEWRLLRVLELPDHAVLVRRMSTSLVLRLWGAISGGICGVLKLDLAGCDSGPKLCPEDPDVLAILKNNIVRLLLSREAAAFSCNDKIQCGCIVRPVTIQILDFWLLHDAAAVVTILCRAFRADGAIDRCILLRLLNERLKDPCVSKLMCAVLTP